MTSNEIKQSIIQCTVLGVRKCWTNGYELVEKSSLHVPELQFATNHDPATTFLQVVFPSFGERYLSSVLFESVRKEAEGQTCEP